MKLQIKNPHFEL